MAGEPIATDKLLVALSDDNAVVRVVGRGSFKVSSPLRDFGIAAIKMDAKRIILDMRDCIGMDSTFMGTIAGLSLRLRKQNPESEVVFLNLSEKTDSLLRTLGLNHITTTYLAGDEPDDIAALFSDSEEGYRVLAQHREEDEQEATKKVLDAHEALVDISPDNITKFRDVIDFLREDLKNNSDA